MKKTALLLSCLFAAGSACASSVTLYGLIDMGFSLSQNSQADDVKLTLKSGQRNGSRFGIKGVEDLANGWKAGFILEDQFRADDGTLQDSSFWARESVLYLEGSIGRFTFGKTGQLKSPVGSVALAGTIMYPFGTLMSNYIGGQKYITSGTYLTTNNAITYRSPDFNGWTFHAQYSLAMNDEGAHTNSDDRYAAVAARYRKGKAVALLLADKIFLDSEESKTWNDPWSVTAAANYDFGFVKPYIYFQYFENGALNAVGSDWKPYRHAAAGRYDGFGVLAALQWPMFGGRAKIGGGYTDADGADSTATDVKRWSASLGFDYSLSKRTEFYADLGWVRQKLEGELSSGQYRRIDGEELSVGIVHRF
jgi:predicted porin